jgi:hypothetical protein
MVLMIIGAAFLAVGAFPHAPPSTGGSAAIQTQYIQDAAWRTTVLIKGAETLSIMAAALLIFIIISARSQDAILTLLGVMIIAAIIIPTQEIARIAGVIGIGEPEQAEGSARSGRGTFVDFSHSERVARRAIAELMASPEAGMIVREGILGATGGGCVAGGRSISSAVGGQARASPDEQRRNQTCLEERLSVLLYYNDLDTLEAAVRQRGLDRQLLDTLSSDRMQRTALLPTNARRARDELIALRDLGLVSMSQVDITSAGATRLGAQVLCGIHPDHPDVRQAIATQIRTSNPASLQRCLSLSPADAGAAGSRPAIGFNIGPETQLPLRQAVSVTDTRGVSIPLAVTAPQGPLHLRVETTNPSIRFDPILELRRLDDEDLIASDDDSAGRSNARINWAFETGRYDLRLANLAGGLGSATIIVDRLTQAQFAALQGMESAVISLDGFPAPGSIGPVPTDPARPLALVIPADGALFGFTLASQADITLDLFSTQNDLEMSLYRRMQSAASLIRYNDDRGGPSNRTDGRRTLDPLISATLEAGEYVLRVRELSRHQTNATLVVTSP